MRNALAEAGFNDVNHAHGVVLEQLVNEGGRAVDMAERAQMTKQAFGELVAALVARGYVLQRSDPVDRRARVLALSARGRRLVATVQRAQRAIEAEWAARLGRRRFTQLRRSLADAVRAAPGASP